MALCRDRGAERGGRGRRDAGGAPLTPRATIWLAEPSRFAALSAARARIALSLLALLLLATLTALAVPDAQRGVGGVSDIALYETIVDAIRHGGDYYTVAADAMRAGAYPLRPFFTMRLPTLAVIEAALPARVIAVPLVVLAIAVAWAWYRRLGQAVRGSIPRTVTAFLLAAGLVAFVQPALAAFHEIWAGLLIALSLALHRRGRWIEPVAIGLAAMLIRETAAVYVAVMALFALLEGERRELAGWSAATAVFAVVIALHASAVGAVVGPLDPASPGWAGMLGFGHFVRAMAQSTALSALPLWLAAPIVGLALFGWAAWRDPAGLRVLTILAGYALLLGLFARADTFYWGLMVAPLLLSGLVFVPDALRDLVAAAFDRRRFTVTRTGR